MAILDDSDLDTYNDLVFDLLAKDTCTINRPSRTGSGGNGAIPGVNAVAAWLQVVIIQTPKMPKELIEATQLESNTIYLALLPRGTDVQQEDRLVVSNGVTYRVLATLRPSYEAVRQSYVTIDPFEEGK